MWTDGEKKDGKDGDDEEEEEERTQELLAKRFAKRARMQRLVEMYGDSQEFSTQRLIEEDESMKSELAAMKVRTKNVYARVSCITEFLYDADCMFTLLSFFKI